MVIEMKDEYVTIHTKEGGVGIGKIDEQGRLIWRAGKWIPVPKEYRDVRDRILKKRCRRDNSRWWKRIQGCTKGIESPTHIYVIKYQTSTFLSFFIYFFLSFIIYHTRKKDL